MKKLRIIARVLVVDGDKILLARNRGTKFWYPPGGGWEYDQEHIKEAAAREVAEETGYTVDIQNLLWVQEFREAETVYFETFWRATLAETNTQNTDGLTQHTDLDENGAVEEVRWFTEEELRDKKVFPENVKSFTSSADSQADAFLGSF